jgi:RNA methyltransferase, TrmH family
MLQRTKKLIKSLQVKKYRKEEQSFVVEGAKSVLELLASDFEIIVVAASPAFMNDNAAALRAAGVGIEQSTENELTAAGTLQTNDAAIAVAKMKPNLRPVIKQNEFIIALDDIRDPGNAGTIIRTADWFGIKNIIASEETADFYNSKTISATMGSFCRVNFFYTSLPEFLSSSSHKKYGAFLEGEDVHKIVFGSGGIIVIGNESNGISNEVKNHIDQKITIPRHGLAESLNAGVSAAIILDNVRRGS